MSIEPSNVARPPAELHDQITRAAMLAGVDASAQAMRVATLEAELAEAGAEEARASRDDMINRMALVARAVTAQGAQVAERWEKRIAPLLAELDTDLRPANEIIVDLARALHIEQHLPLGSDEAMRKFLDDPNATIVFTGMAALYVGPPKDRLDDLGARVKPPGALDRDQVASWAATPHDLCVDPFAGLHISIERSGGVYRHHGVLLGGGYVADFAGARTTASKSIRIIPIEQFIDASDPATIRWHFPERQGHPPVAVHPPNLTALRAASMEGSDGYHLFNRNCEHFAAWAQCGAMVSGQVERLLMARELAGARTIGQNLAKVGVGGKLNPAAVMGLFIKSWTMTVGHTQLPPPPLHASAAAPAFYDLGRVWWSRDQNDFVWWIPMWTSGDPRRITEHPHGPTDRPFAVGPDPGTAIWHAQRPAIGISTDWHAALVGSPSGSTFLVDSDGNWRSPKLDFQELVVTRSAAMEELHRALAPADDVFEQRVAPDPSSTNQIGPGDL